MAAQRGPRDFGGTLRAARERRGLSLRQIASATKISVITLEALERNDLAQAERFAARAVANDPYQSDYVALHTWIRAMMSNRPESLNEAILALSKLLSSDPKSERALLYRGKLLKKMSRIREALRDFERLVQANPRHREGVQELRLLRQRATK